MITLRRISTRYQNQEITVEIETGLIQGKMALRAMRMVMDWFEKHQKELAENWELARAHKSLKPVPPLA